MAFIDDPATGETLTRTIADTILASLDGNDQAFGKVASELRDGANIGPDIHGGFGTEVPDRRAGNVQWNDREVAARDTDTVPIFNLFRPF